jgi:subtilisin
MPASSDDPRSTASSDRRKSVRDPRPATGSERRKVARTPQYLIAPAGPGLSQKALAERLNQFANIQILRIYDQSDTISPPIAIVRMPDDTASALRRAESRTLIIEPDGRLRAATYAGVPFFRLRPS